MDLRHRFAIGLGLAFGLIGIAPPARAQNAIVFDTVTGTVLDFDGNRILFASGGVASIKDHATGVITGYGAISAPRGWLTNAGAVWSDGEARGGVFTARPGLAVQKGSGDWFLWRRSSAVQGNDLVRENQVTGTVETLVSVDNYGDRPDIDETGHAAFSRTYAGNGGEPTALYEADATGTQTRLITLAGGTSDGVAPLVAGDRIVFSAHVSSGLFTRAPLSVYTPGGVVVLDTTNHYSNAPPFIGNKSYVDYVGAPSGWLAYTKYVGGTSYARRTVWTYSPGGDAAQVGTMASIASVTAINDTGQVVYVQSGTGQFLSSAASADPPLEIPTGAARAIDGSWYVLNAGTVYLVQPGATPTRAPRSTRAPTLTRARTLAATHRLSIIRTVVDGTTAARCRPARAALLCPMLVTRMPTSIRAVRSRRSAARAHRSCSAPASWSCAAPLSAGADCVGERSGPPPPPRPQSAIGRKTFVFHFAGSGSVDGSVA